MSIAARFTHWLLVISAGHGVSRDGLAGTAATHETRTGTSTTRVGISSQPESANKQAIVSLVCINPTGLAEALL